MQGFILDLRRIRDEDTLVTVLSEHRVVTLYRFYGARHAAIHLGYKIDFELETSAKTTIGRLRNVMHLGYAWLFARERLFVWQQLCRLMAAHLRDVEEIDPFYYRLMDETAARWDKTDPRRLAVESYLALLEHEGRLYTDPLCFACETPIEGDIALGRAFLPAHPECVSRMGFPAESLRRTLEHGKTLPLDDLQVERLYAVMTEGF